MNSNHITRRFRLVELFVVIVIIVVLLGLLIPFVNSAREASRRIACMQNSQQIGLGMHNFLSTYNSFPPSASVTKATGGGTQTVGGWSFLVRLLPYMDHDALFKTLPTDGDPEDTSNSAIVAALNTQLSDLVCPSGPRGSAWRNVGAGITNYKAMGATTRNSLVIAANPQATPPYGTAKRHPDGAIFPGTGTLSSDFVDGMSHTIVMIETMDEVASRWSVGKEVTLVGLPQKSSPTGATPQDDFSYFAPPGYGRNWGDSSCASAAGVRTFLTYDFSPKGADAGQYEDAGFAQTPPAYGPSSAHPAVVICCLGDGSGQALSKRVDAANFFFLITKSGKDPFYFPGM